jgi:hypothetical protein
MSQYQKAKSQFLDSLNPDDFRNPSSFNVAEDIIDELNKSCFAAAKNNKNPDEFITKALTHLFRQDSCAVEKAINLSKIYLVEIYLVEKGG